MTTIVELGDPTEKRASQALGALQRGLRSGDYEERCEAIIRFTHLFHEYPFGFVVTSAFLKLGDVFRTSDNNFIRLEIVKVVEESAEYHGKLDNVDEIFRRFYAVFLSNDPIARSLTLRAMASLAPVICERKDAHHSVFEALRSSSSMELEAAIVAANKFCARSGAMMAGLEEQLADMLLALETPTHIRLRLAPLLRHNYRSAAAVRRTQTLCDAILAAFPTKDVTLVVIRTLSLLAHAAPLDLQRHVQRLCDFALTDPRLAVKLCALHDLRVLCRATVAALPPASLEAVVRVLREAPQPALQAAALGVLQHAAALQDVLGGADLGSLLSLVAHFDARVASAAATLCAVLAERGTAAALQPAVGVALGAMLALHAASPFVPVMCRSVARVAICSAALAALCFAALVDLIPQYPSVHAHAALALRRIALAFPAQVPLGDLVALADALPLPSHSRLVSELLAISLAASRASTRPPSSTTTGSSSSSSSPAASTISTEESTAITRLLGHGTGWAALLLAQRAASVGAHAVAALICQSLLNAVQTEASHAYLAALHQCSAAEADLVHRGDQLVAAVSSLQAARTAAFDFQFQRRFVQLRIDMVECLEILTQQESFGASRMRLGRPPHLDMIASKLRSLVQKWQALREICYDADSASLEIIRSLYAVCAVLRDVCLGDSDSAALLAEGLERQLAPAEHHQINGGAVVNGPKPQTASSSSASRPSSALVGVILQLMKDYPTASSSSAAWQAWLSRAGAQLLAVPLCLPPFFFRHNEATVIQLSICAGDRHAAPLSEFMFTVEGCIRRSRRSHGKRIKSVEITLSSCFWKDSEDGEPLRTVVRQVPVRESIFASEFAFALPALPAGSSTQTNVKISGTAAMFDTEGNKWTPQCAEYIIVKLDSFSRSKKAKKRT